MTETILLQASLVFPITETHVALGLKKQKIGAGLLNGAGGGLEPGEDALACAIREAKEEWDITFEPSSLHKVAVVDFHNRKSDGSTFTCRVHVFLADAWSGEAAESPEMGAPTWFPKDHLPLEQMMLADRDWFPRIIAGELLYAEAWYGPKQQTLEQSSVVRVIDADTLTNL